MKETSVEKDLSLAMIYLGQRLRERRKMLGWTQNDVAAAMGATEHQVPQWEIGRNEMSVSDVARLAAALKVPVGYFFDESDDAGTQWDEESRLRTLLKARSPFRP